MEGMCMKFKTWDNACRPPSKAFSVAVSFPEKYQCDFNSFFHVGGMLALGLEVRIFGRVSMVDADHLPETVFLAECGLCNALGTS